MSGNPLLDLVSNTRKRDTAKPPVPAESLDKAFRDLNVKGGLKTVQKARREEESLRPSGLGDARRVARSRLKADPATHDVVESAMYMNAVDSKGNLIQPDTPVGSVRDYSVRPEVRDAIIKEFKDDPEGAIKKYGAQRDAYREFRNKTIGGAKTPDLKSQQPGAFEQTGTVPAPLDPEQTAAEALNPNVDRFVQSGIDDRRLHERLDEAVHQFAKGGEDIGNAVASAIPGPQIITDVWKNVAKFLGGTGASIVATPATILSAIDFSNDETKPGFDRAMSFVNALVQMEGVAGSPVIGPLLGRALKGGWRGMKALFSHLSPAEESAIVKGAGENGEAVGNALKGVKQAVQEVPDEVGQEAFTKAVTPDSPPPVAEVPETPVQAPETTIPQGGPNASQVQETATLHGDVREQPPVVEQTVPAQEGGPGVHQAPKEEVIPEGAVAAANRVTETVRESVGLNGHPPVPPETMGQWADQAAAKGHDTVEGASRLAQDVLDGKKPQLTDDETIGMSSALAKLLKEHEEVGKAYLATAEKGGDPVLADRLQDITDKINTITTATNRAGTEWGRAGAARAALVTDETQIAGVLAKRQKAAGRPLTPTEVAEATRQVDELKSVIAEKDARIAELEKGDAGKAQATLDQSRTSPRVKKAELDAKIKDAKSRLAEKWKKSQPKPMVRSSVFGIDVAAEQLDRLAQVAPELLELSKLGVQKGYLVLSENTKFVVSELKKIGVKDISENDVAAVLAGKATSPKVGTPTEYQNLKSQARRTFQAESQRIKEEASLIAQREREIRRSHPPGALRDREMAAIAADKAKNQAESNALKSADKRFWEDVRKRERGHKASEQKAATAERRESQRRFSADPNARLMSSIANLEDKLKTFDAEGIVKGAKSKLTQPKDATVRALEVREASLKNQFRKVQNDLKAQQEYDQLPPSMKFLQKFNPWNGARAMVASMDMSFPLNQGAMTLFSDPKAWWKGTKDGFRSWTAKGLDRVEAEISAHPDYDAAKAAGLFEEGSNLADVFGASKFSKVPGISNSERAYEGAANSMRLELFSQWKRLADGMGGKPMDVADLKKLADEVKTWTGQGVWGKNAQHVSKPFFALRYRLSQIETALGAPLARTGAHWLKTGQSAPFKIVARKYARAYATVAATAVVANEALKAWGPKRDDGEPAVYFDLNPLSTNAGRLVQWHGTTMHTSDVLPGPFKIYGLLSRIVAGARVTQAGKEEKGMGMSERMAGEWIFSGAHPALSQGWALTRASMDDNHEYFGKTLDLTQPEGVANLLMGFAPISANTVKDILYDENMSPVEKSWALILVPTVQQSIKDKAKQPERK